MDKNLLDKLLRSFLREDIGRGDLTSEAIFSAEPDRPGRSRGPRVLSGGRCGADRRRESFGCRTPPS